MSEEAGSNDPQVEELENTADDLAHQGDKLQDDIESTRHDWEGKKGDASVPGAVPDPDDEPADPESGEDEDSSDDGADEVEDDGDGDGEDG